MEHNVSVIQQTSITWFIMHAQMYLVVSTRIFILPQQRSKPKRYTISIAWFTKGSTQVVPTQRSYNLTIIRAALMKTVLIKSQRSWQSSSTIRSIVSVVMLLLLKPWCNSPLFCLWVDLPSPAAASPSPGATATATATTSPTSAVLRIWD